LRHRNYTGRANLYHVKDLLGHETLDTLRHYAKLNVDDLRKTLARCHPPRTRRPGPALNRYFPFSCQPILAPSEPVKGLAHHPVCECASLGERGRTRVAPCDRLRGRTTSTSSCTRFRGSVVAFPLHRVGAKNRCTRILDNGVYRARYFNPGTGTFWTMDTYEGNSKDPLSLHKYLYCEANPIDHADQSGHDLDSMPDISANIMINLLGFQIVPSVSLFAASDFTVKVNVTLNQIEQSFDSQDATAKRKLVAEITKSESFRKAWDIIELAYPSAAQLPDSWFTYNPPGIVYGPPPDNPTVAFQGFCYYANAVNYAMFGLMFKLAERFTGDNFNWSEGRAVWYAKEYDIWYNNEGPGNLDYEEKLAFTRYGYSGTKPGASIPGILPLFGAGTTAEQPLHWCWEPIFPRLNPYPGQKDK